MPVCRQAASQAPLETPLTRSRRRGRPWRLPRAQWRLVTSDIATRTPHRPTGRPSMVSRRRLAGWNSPVGEASAKEKLTALQDLRRGDRLIQRESGERGHQVQERFDDVGVIRHQKVWRTTTSPTCSLAAAGSPPSVERPAGAANGSAAGQRRYPAWGVPCVPGSCGWPSPPRSAGLTTTLKRRGRRVSGGALWTWDERMRM